MIIAILTGVKGYLVVYICISLMTNNVEHLFMYLLAICISSMKKCIQVLREGNGNPFQYSCLENPTDRGAWQATVHEVARVGHDLVTKPSPPPFKSFAHF